MEYTSNEDENGKNQPNYNRKSTNEVQNIGRGKPFPTWSFKEEDSMYVDKIPDLIDG